MEHLQCKAVRPTVREILNVDFLIRSCLALTPEKQTLFRRQPFFALYTNSHSEQPIVESEMRAPKRQT